MKCLGFALFLAVFTAVGAIYVGNSHTESLPIKSELEEGQCYKHVDYPFGGIAHIEELPGFDESSYEVKYTYVNITSMEKITKTRLRDGFKQLYPKEVHCSEYARANIKYEKHLKDKERELELTTLKAKVKNLELRIENIEYNITIEDFDE